MKRSRDNKSSTVPREKYELLKKIANDWFLKCEELNDDLKKLAKQSKKDIKSASEQNYDKIVQLERSLILKDGKIQNLEDSYKDLKDRYLEMKEDLREQQRWNRTGREEERENLQRWRTGREKGESR